MIRSKQGNENSNLQQPLPSQDEWWKLFKDPILDSLIIKAVNRNYDVRIAIRKIEMAKSKLRVDRSPYYPSIDLTVNYAPEKSSLSADKKNIIERNGTATLNLNWELDIFGRIRKESSSQKEFYLAAQEDYRGVMVSMAAQLSTAYINLRTAQKQLQVTQENLESQKKVMELTVSKFDVGLVSQLDVAQSKSLYLQTKASIPGIESSINEEINLISVLIGEHSDLLREKLLKAEPIPTNPRKAALGIPANLIRQRPDVRSAERTIDGLAAAVGASRADWWPKFLLTGFFGYSSEQFENFTDRDNMIWQIAPTMKWTIFSGRNLVESEKTAQLQLEEEINNYNQTLLTAIQEVDNAMVTYNKSLQQISAMKEAFQQSKLTLELAIKLYKSGLTNYQNVLSSQVSLLNYENSLIQAQSISLRYLIQLYQALGGGWPIGDRLEK
ncbi:efflux transporter outer membrane subunit [Gabonibacter chumensis]|uniref:efflux transporter outer membrane subunit n=1 Tax=Gabonibacter chumensis TaxID=2972474 RepID=UPI002573AD61|nr:efflux transporter outer membrane subunit [Gabonibacter chumensis]MCR9010947.1 efflux transporter outer membrane subunit [Gabonibacter chumensis]